MPSSLQNVAAFGPDFMCVGAQKGGTGWLYEQLRFHPDFWMPPLKELHYFDRRWRSPRAARKKSERLGQARATARDERDLRFLDAMEELQARDEIDLQGYTKLFASKGSLLSGDITPGYSTLEDEAIESITRHLPEMKVLFMARDPWKGHGRIFPCGCGTRPLNPSRPTTSIKSPGTCFVPKSRPAPIQAGSWRAGAGTSHRHYFASISLMI